MKLFHRLLIASVFLVIGGIYMIVLGLLPPPALVDVETMVFEEYTDDRSFYIQDLAVVWEYGSINGDDEDSGLYYLSYFFDRNGQLCTASLFFDNSEEWKATSDAHDYNETDMIMGGCFKVETLLDFDTVMEGYYQDTLAEFKEISGNYLGITDVRDTGLHLWYVCDEMADYASAAKNSSALLCGIALFAIAGILILISIPLMKKAKAQEEASRIQMTTAQFDPYTGAPIYPQYPYGTRQGYAPGYPYGDPQGYPPQDPYNAQSVYPTQNPYAYPVQEPYNTPQNSPVQDSYAPSQPTQEDRDPYQGPEF